MLSLATLLCGALEQFTIPLDAAGVHYTSCLLESRGVDKLPEFARSFDNVEISDRKSDSRKFNIIVFSAVVGRPPASTVVINATCGAMLGRVTDGVEFGSIATESRFIQHSRCFGLNITGYSGQRVGASFDSSTGSVAVSVNSASFYSQTPLTPHAAPLVTRDNVYLDTYHTHNTPTDDKGLIMRVYNLPGTSIDFRPVNMHVNAKVFNHLFNASIVEGDIHTCFSFERPSQDNSPLPILIENLYDAARPADAFYQTMDSLPASQTLVESLRIGHVRRGSFNLETEMFHAADLAVNPLAVLQPKWASYFRTVVMILDFCYPFLASLQKVMNGVYPSHRFDTMRRTIQLHALVGAIGIYSGCALHIHELTYGMIREADDDDDWRQALYYCFGVAMLIHCLTVFLVLPKVMGERRITMPLYLGAGLINLYNAIQLLVTPNLANAFFLWGSVNVFIFVRFQVFLLCFARIDWALVYTYGILAAAATIFPLTLHDPNVYWLLALPIIYSPFHESIAPLFGWSLEDDISGTAVEKDLAFHYQIVNAAKGMQQDMSQIISLTNKLSAAQTAKANKQGHSTTSENKADDEKESSLALEDVMEEVRELAQRLESIQSATHTINTLGEAAIAERQSRADSRTTGTRPSAYCPESPDRTTRGLRTSSASVAHVNSRISAAFQGYENMTNVGEYTVPHVGLRASRLTQS